DGVVQYVLNAADYVVLPYNRILTSGAVALALGFGKPVIVPDLPALSEVVQHGREALVFRAGDQSALAQATLNACAQDKTARRHVKVEALRTGKAVMFSDLAAAMLARIKIDA